MKMPLEDALRDLRSAAAETMEIPDVRLLAERARALFATKQRRPSRWIAAAGALVVALGITGGLLHWYRSPNAPVTATPSHPSIYFNQKRYSQVPVRMYIPDVWGYSCGRISYTPATSSVSQLSQFWTMSEFCTRTGRPAKGLTVLKNGVLVSEASYIVTVGMTHTQPKKIGGLTVVEGKIDDGGQLLNGLYYQYGSTTYSYRPWTILGGKIRYAKPKLRTSSVSISLMSRAPMRVLEEFALSMRLLKP